MSLRPAALAPNFIACFACVTFVTPLAACVDAEPRRGMGDTSSDADTSDATPEVSNHCVRDQDCPAVSDTCEVRACDSGTCGSRPAPADTPCDDGNPCTGVGSCDGTVCAPGPSVADTTPCDDGRVCNGVRTCQAGVCVDDAPKDCPVSDDPCIADLECSEEAGGLCLPVLAANGQGCIGPTEALNRLSWNCSQGTCVPPRMVFIPAGRFTMGCSGNGCHADNVPAHEVDLSAFLIDENETTERELQACRRDESARGFKCQDRIGETMGAIAAAPDEPVRQLDWFNADTLCKYKGKRLCTEAEWERAARGPTKRIYPWGNEAPDCTRATFAQGGVGCGLGGPSPVGVKPPGQTSEGTLDLAGNVAEWVADYYRVDLYATRSSAPTDPMQSTPHAGVEGRVVRGGGYRSLAGDLRSFVRSAQLGNTAHLDIGVRCCADWNPR